MPVTTIDSRPIIKSNNISNRLLGILACPVTHSPLCVESGALVSIEGRRYEISPDGIPLFATEYLSDEARIQQAHYDRVVTGYIANLSYPHTQEYMGFLDEELVSELKDGSLGYTVELCCGRGEAFYLLQQRIGEGLGIDVSERMLKVARQSFPKERFTFVQGDATRLPLQDQVVDTVIMLGGIHHVPDRHRLYSEILRILKPGGYFYWREPANDFFLWRWIRKVIYYISPALDHATERPLTYKETIPLMKGLGFDAKTWKTSGFLGFCLFMNSDVLVFNRVFRFIPGIREITQAAVFMDKWTVRLPGLKRAGLQVVGVAQKPGV
jgi:SAM-dependent methyltransferase